MHMCGNNLWDIADVDFTCMGLEVQSVSDPVLFHEGYYS